MLPKDSARVETALTTHAGFEGFTDSFVWEALRRRVDEGSQAADAIVRRKRIQFLQRERDLAEYEKNNVARDLKAANDERTGRSVQIVRYDSRLKFSKLSGRYGNIRLLHLDRGSNKKRLAEISRHTDLFTKFRDTELTHFFAAPDWYSPAEANRPMNNSVPSARPKRKAGMRRRTSGAKKQPTER